MGHRDLGGGGAHRRRGGCGRARRAGRRGGRAPGDVRRPGRRRRDRPLGLLALLQLLTAATDRPIVAAGGIATGAGIAAVLAAGAAAAQLGTAFLRCPEAGTNPVHRAAVPTETPTMLTRAFTGRLARGVRNDFMARHSASAPAAYPEIHFATAPLRAEARSSGNPENVNLWAGQAHSLTSELPAGELVRQLAEETKAALDSALSRRIQPC
nr:nitronate monooxygenase [Nocardia farcinica]